MRPDRLARRALAALAWLAVSALVPGAALAAPELRGTQRAAAPDASAGAPAAEASAPAAPALPPGHPPLDADDGADELPPGHPPAAPGSRAAPLPQGPEDGAEIDRELPAGTIVVDLRDVDDRPLPNAELTLGILQQSVAKGESHSRTTGRTDATGHARFDGLQTGAGIAYRVSVAWSLGPDGKPTDTVGTFGAPPFQLDLQRGMRVRLHVAPVTSRLDQSLVGAQVGVLFELKDEAIQVQEVFDIVNVGRAAWVPRDVVIDLPHGFRAFATSEQMSGVGVDQVEGRGVRLRGTFPPGESEVSFRYQLPRDGESQLAIATGLPPRTARMRVIAEATPGMSLEVAGFPAARPERMSEGQRVLVTERQLRPGEAAVDRMSLTLRNLPGPGPGRWWAAAMAALAAAAGVLAVARARRTGPDAAAVREDAERARDRLVAELATLERLRASGEVGPKSYERIRAALLDALARALAATGDLAPRGG